MKSSNMKKSCQNRHARRRARERFGLNMGPKTHEKFIKAIQSGEARFVEKQSNRISLWDCDHDGELVRLVYDRHRKQIVTFLHPEPQPETTAVPVPREENKPDDRPKRDRQFARFGISRESHERLLREVAAYPRRG